MPPSIVYESVCLGRSVNYVVETEKTYYKITQEHDWTDKDSVINNHLNEYEGIKQLFSFRCCFQTMLVIVILILDL